MHSDFFNPEKYSDAGSDLGRFFWKLLGPHETLVNLVTRGAYALLIAAALLPLAFMNVLYWSVGSLFLVLASVFAVLIIE